MKLDKLKRLARKRPPNDVEEFIQLCYRIIAATVGAIIMFWIISGIAYLIK